MNEWAYFDGFLTLFLGVMEGMHKWLSAERPSHFNVETESKNIQMWWRGPKHINCFSAESSLHLNVETESRI